MQLNLNNYQYSSLYQHSCLIAFIFWASANPGHLSLYQQIQFCDAHEVTMVDLIRSLGSPDKNTTPGTTNWALSDSLYLPR